MKNVLKKVLGGAAAAAGSVMAFAGTAMADSTSSSSSGTSAQSWLMIIVYFVIIIAVMYFIAIRPQSKEKKQQQQMLSQLEIGDIVLTTSGFYGTIIDITDDTVIVEFGNNKNCRIPMQKTAIVECEKPDGSSPTAPASGTKSKDTK
jgi:preprotein translocase subunit YajC